MRIVRQNFAIAIRYNVFAVPLALLGLATPLLAALALSGALIIVVTNNRAALRIWIDKPLAAPPPENPLG